MNNIAIMSSSSLCNTATISPMKHNAVGVVSYNSIESTTAATPDDRLIAVAAADRLQHCQSNSHHPTDILLSYQDVFDQWDALIERQGHEAYAVQNRRLPITSSMDAKDREVLVQWSYQIVDRFDLDRGIVSIAISYFDRLVYNSGSSCALSIEKCDWEVAFMTCLHLAIKQFSFAQKTFSARTLANFGNGCVSEQDVLLMERRICQGFHWYLNPPVSAMYVDILSPLFMKELPVHDTASNAAIQEELRHHAIEQARYLCQNAVLDTFFINKASSSMAYAAVLVALKLMKFPAESTQWFVSLPLQVDWAEMNDCAQHLHEAFEWYEPEVTFDSFANHDTTSVEANKTVMIARAVTPTKDDEIIVSRNKKRSRQDMEG